MTLRLVGPPIPLAEGRGEGASPFQRSRCSAEIARKYSVVGKHQPLPVLCFLAAAAPMTKNTIANTKNIVRDVPCVGSTAIAKKTAAATRYPHLAMNLFIVITPSYSQ